MKAIVCEMCSGNDFAKVDGMFVCQNCGTKYSPEEAKKMMIEGTVDVKGTVTVDNSAMVQKYLQNARRAKEKEDWAEVEKYYNLAEQEDPTNIEAIFYSAFGKAKQTLVDSDLYKRQAAFKVLNKSVSIIDDHFDVSKEDEQYKLVTQILSDVNAMRGSSFVYNTTRKTVNGVTSTTDDRQQTYNLFDSLQIEMRNTLSSLEEKLQNKNYKINILKYLIKAVEESGLNENRVSVISGYYRRLAALDSTVNAEEKIAELNQRYNEKLEAQRKENRNNLIGCFVFIAVCVVLGVLFGIWMGNS